MLSIVAEPAFRGECGNSWEQLLGMAHSACNVRKHPCLWRPQAASASGASAKPFRPKSDEERVQYKEHRRVCHINAEQKRRFNIKVGLVGHFACSHEALLHRSQGAFSFWNLRSSEFHHLNLTPGRLAFGRKLEAT